LEIIFFFPPLLVVSMFSFLGAIFTYELAKLADPPLVVLPFIFIINLVDVASSMATSLSTYLLNKLFPRA
jgi:hypothetical protein